MKTFLTLLKAQMNAFLATGDFSNIKEHIERPNVHKKKIDSNNTHGDTSQTTAKLPVKNLTGEYKKLKDNTLQHLQKNVSHHKEVKFGLALLLYASKWCPAGVLWHKGPSFPSSFFRKSEYPNYDTSLRRYFTVAVQPQYTCTDGGRTVTFQSISRIIIVRFQFRDLWRDLGKVKAIILI